MKLPMIDLASLPDVYTVAANLTGMFGRTTTPGHDDTIVVLMTIVYETQPPGGGII
jgi:hypothetical protein